MIDVETINAIRRSDEPGRVLAARHGYSRSFVVGIQLGTFYPNVGDPPRTSKRRCGATNCNARLTDEKVREILLSPLTHREAARAYGVRYSTIDAIRRGLSWKHVDRTGALTNEDRKRLRKAAAKKAVGGRNVA